jgi:hypothetical protein
MFFPDLGAGVEEVDLHSGSWIAAYGPIRLGQIAGGARQLSIGWRIGTALPARADVFDVKAVAADALRRVTILAAPAGAFLHTAAQSSGG